MNDFGRGLAEFLFLLNMFKVESCYWALDCFVH